MPDSNGDDPDAIGIYSEVANANTFWGGGFAPRRGRGRSPGVQKRQRETHSFYERGRRPRCAQYAHGQR